MPFSPGPMMHVTLGANMPVVIWARCVTDHFAFEAVAWLRFFCSLALMPECNGRLLMADLMPLDYPAHLRRLVEILTPGLGCVFPLYIHESDQNQQTDRRC